MLRFSIGCIEVTCGGGSWQEEVSWTINYGSEELSGGAPLQENLIAMKTFMVVLILLHLTMKQQPTLMMDLVLL